MKNIVSVIIYTFALTSIALIITLLMITFNSQLHNASRFPQRSAAAIAAVSDNVTPSPATQVPTPQVSDVSPTVQQAPAPAPAPAVTSLPTYKWADHMHLSGIAASDYGFVNDMVLDTNGWRVEGPNLWQHAASSTAPLGFNLQRVNYYVIHTYTSWSAAHDKWTSTGDF
jgi:hypothetical protein